MSIAQMLRRHACLVACAALVFTCSIARAQSVTLDQFRPAETPYDDFQIARAVGQGHLRFAGQLHLSYANDPLVAETVPGEASSERYRIVEHHLNLTAGVSFGLWNRLVIFAGLPITAVMSGDSNSTLMGAGLVTPDGAGIGDVYLGTKFVLPIPSDVFALALRTTLTFPTANAADSDQRLRGDGFISVMPDLIAEVHSENGMRLALNVGARVREDGGSGLNLSFQDELTFGLGGALPVWINDDDTRTHLDLHAQLWGASSFRNFGDREHIQIEAMGGAKFWHALGIVAGLAAGPGITRGFGTPDVRIVGMIGYAPVDGRSDRDGDGLYDDVDECPDQPEDRDQFEDENGCPDPDNDQDGVLDVNDECVNVAEDRDGFEDENGCPDPDNDRDGINDVDEECDNEPEDRDSFEDENGCPEPDNDHDGVLDTDDRCPLEPGVASNQGCPEPDRDHDTVIDRLDNCPDELGPPANQGCAAVQQVRIDGEQLLILDVVHFKTNRAEIEPRSFPLLNNVAQVLTAHPEVGRIRVEGHTDARGRRTNNMRLSQQRAEAIVRYLTTQGHMDAQRLEAVGFGPDRPIVENATTAEEHARNRRVEFHLLGSTANVEQRHIGPDSDTIDR